jgi:hypothetical protein
VKSVQLAETPEQLALEEKHALSQVTAQSTTTTNRLASLMGASKKSDQEATGVHVPPLQSKAVDTVSQTSTVQPQRVTITADGRRRIQPQFIRR